MKRFTPDLMERFASDDAAVWKLAEAEWDNRAEQYQAYVDSIKESLPGGLRQIVDSYYLHDAIVRGMGQREGSFVIFLQLYTKPHSLLTLTYELTSDPKIDHEAVPLALRTGGEHVEWLYDEIERTPGAAPEWAQSILFSNGWEVHLEFRDVRVEEAQALIPAPLAGGAAPLSASERQSA